MERSSKHFFAFILDYISLCVFFWAKLVMVVKDGELSLKKAFVWFFYEIKCSAFWDDEPITKLECAQYWRFVEDCCQKKSLFRDNKKCIIAPLIRTHLKSIFGFRIGRFQRRSLLNCGWTVSYARHNNHHHDSYWGWLALIVCTIMILQPWLNLLVADSLLKQAELEHENYDL